MIKRGLLYIFIFCAFAATASDPVKEALSKAGDGAKYPGENQLVVFDSMLVDMQESGLTYVTVHTLTRALTAKGAMDLNVVKFGYDPLSAWVEIRKVIVHRKDGSSVLLDTAKTLDYPAPARAIYWGAREKMIGVGRLEPGDAVEVVLFRKGFTYALLQDEDDRYIPPMKGQFYDIVEFFGPNAVIEKVYSVQVPKTKALQYQVYNGELQTGSWLEKDKMVYTFTKRNMAPLKTESRMVAQSDVAPKLLLSTSPDWYAKSTWFFGVNEEFGSFDWTPEIKAKVDEILKGAKTEMDSVSRLTHWCGDEIRYSGISMGEGEGFTLHKGEMTFTDRCGVCKDKAGMLITMLRAAGFKSYPAMTMAGSRIDYIPADQFNHCVTVVKLNDGKYHLLDPTWVPFLRELWSSAEQQQEYLMGVPEGADLATTPLSAPENHYVRITGQAKLSESGTLTGSVEITAEGQSDAAVRGMLRNYKPELWKGNLEKELMKIHPKAQVTRTEYSDPFDYMAGPIRIRFEYVIPDYALVSGGVVLFTPVTAAQVFKNFQGHLFFDTGLKERKYAFRDRCSRLVEISETIELPQGLTAVRIPEKVSREGKAASFTGGYALQGNQLAFSAKAVYGKRIYEAADWPEFRSAVEGQNRFAEQGVILNTQNSKLKSQN
jgi:hypothetical protein